MTDDLLTAEEFAGFLAAKKRKVSRNTYPVVRVACAVVSGAGATRKLRVRHLDAMYDAIEEHNELIAVYRASGDPAKGRGGEMAASGRPVVDPLDQRDAEDVPEPSGQ
ncbi:hypothetical protein [Amycolatopsis sp. WGS_07]|uniref:hypothetical protein n=1 Tax=Amycolatopsis sp. WGS_07 TaxID=3076764 RepID=UPI003873B46F